MRLCCPAGAMWMCSIWLWGAPMIDYRERPDAGAAGTGADPDLSIEALASRACLSSTISTGRSPPWWGSPRVRCAAACGCSAGGQFCHTDASVTAIALGGLGSSQAFAKAFPPPLWLHPLGRFAATRARTDTWIARKRHAWQHLMLKATFISKEQHLRTPVEMDARTLAYIRDRPLWRRARTPPGHRLTSNTAPRGLKGESIFIYHDNSRERRRRPSVSTDRHHRPGGHPGGRGGSSSSSPLATPVPLSHHDRSQYGERWQEHHWRYRRGRARLWGRSPASSALSQREQ